LLKYLQQKGHNTVHWARRCNNTTCQMGPAPSPCIGPRTC